MMFLSSFRGLTPTAALRDDWLIKLPFAIAFGAAIGALMEWQLADGVELYWIVREVEDEFGVKIPEAEWMEVESVGDLLDATVARLRQQQPEQFASDAGARAEEEVWSRLKALLVRQLGLKADQVVPSARFYVDLGL